MKKDVRTAASSASLPADGTVADPVPPGQAGIGLPYIVATLEEDIVCGRLQPDERLIEDRLMERFGVKRHVMREAFAALDHMGLVERRRNIGALVRSFDATKVTELYALRHLLETQAARLIELPVDDTQLASLRTIQERHDKAVADQDLRGVFRSNQDFHCAFFELTGNEVLQQAIAEYAHRTHAMRFTTLDCADHRERSRAEHHAIIAALSGGDRKSLVRLCGQHLLPSRDAYLDACRGVASAAPDGQDGRGDQAR